MTTTPAAQALIQQWRNEAKMLDAKADSRTSDAVKEWFAGAAERADECANELEAALALTSQAGGEAVEPFRNLEDDSTFGEYRDQLAVGNLTAVDQIAFDNLLHKLTEHPKGYLFIAPEDRAPERGHNGRGGDEDRSPGPRKLYAARPAPNATQPEPAPVVDTEHAGLEDSALRFLQGNDLYSLLMDIQNGIDSPATCSIANSLIIRLDKIRATLTSAPRAGVVVEPIRLQILMDGQFTVRQVHGSGLYMLMFGDIPVTGEQHPTQRAAIDAALRHDGDKT